MVRAAFRVSLHEDVGEELNLISKILNLDKRTIIEFAVIHMLSSIRISQMQLVLSPEYKEAIRNANSWQFMQDLQDKLESTSAKELAKKVLLDDKNIRNALTPKAKKQ